MLHSRARTQDQPVGCLFVRKNHHSIFLYPEQPMGQMPHVHTRRWHFGGNVRAYSDHGKQCHVEHPLYFIWLQQVRICLQDWAKGIFSSMTPLHPKHKPVYIIMLANLQEPGQGT